jgi:Membrane domain of glycerophosphoryl diester phosphodiesterase
MTLPTLRPLSVGEILDVSFSLYRRHFSPLVMVALVCSGLPFLLSLFLEAAGGALANPLLALLYYVILVLLSSLATAATVYIVSESYLGRPLSAGEALARSAPLLLRLLLCSFLLALVVGFGLILLLIPGIIFACGLLVAFPVLVLEPGTSAVGALARSWELTRGSRGRMFGLIVTMLILFYIPLAAIGGIAAMVIPRGGFLSGGPAGGVGIIAIAVIGILQLFLYPLFYCVITVAYYDLRVRKEGFDLEVLASTLQPA